MEINKEKILAKCGENYEKYGFLASPIQIEVGSAILPFIKNLEDEDLLPEFKEKIEEVREKTKKDLGIKFPGFRFRLDTDLPPNDYKININEITISKGELLLDNKYFIGNENLWKSFRIYTEELKETIDNKKCYNIRESDWEKFREKNKKLIEPVDFLLELINEKVKHNITEVFLHESAYFLILEILEVGEKFSDIFTDPKEFSLFVTVLKKLLQERVPIVKLDLILDHFLMFKDSNMYIYEMVEAIRSLEEIRPMLPGNNDKFVYYKISSEEKGAIIVDRIKKTMNNRFGEPMLALDDKNMNWILGVIREHVKQHPHEALLVEDSASRGILAQIVMLEHPNIPVLSMDELEPEFEENIIKAI